MNPGDRPVAPDVAAWTERCLLEVMMLLGATDAKQAVVVGGLVPRLLLRDRGEPGWAGRHQGTTDIDLMLPAQLPSGAYAVDLLAPKEGGTSPGHRHQRPQPGTLARKVVGGQIALDHSFTCILAGALPAGGHTSVQLRVADEVAMVVLKALAMSERHKSKDYYDFYFVVRGYRGGPAALGDKLRTYRGDPLVQRALGIIAERFADPEAIGPKETAKELGGSDPALQCNEAHAVAQIFLQAAGFP